MCTIAAPALAASIAEAAICSGVTGTAGFLPGVSAEPGHRAGNHDLALHGLSSRNSRFGTAYNASAGAGYGRRECDGQIAHLATHCALR